MFIQPGDQEPGICVPLPQTFIASVLCTMVRANSCSILRKHTAISWHGIMVCSSFFTTEARAY